MTNYDFAPFLMRDREKPITAEELALVVSLLADVLNSVIVEGYRQPKLLPDAENRFGLAQTELAKAARTLRGRPV